MLGGGVAGLWTLHALRQRGLDALLVETRALGHGQTIASQGILHAGAKYALGGRAAEASRAAAGGSAAWRRCLAGEGPIDLSGASPLSPVTHMFTAPGLGARLAALAASRALAVAPQRLGADRRPAAFADAPPAIDLYQLDEPVLDLPATLEALAAPLLDRLIAAEGVEAEGNPDAPTLRARTSEGEVTITPGVLLCAAGAGNEALLAALGLADRIRAQRRPLHMVLARGPGLPAVWAHCVGASDKPRLTITSATDRAGRTVWYLGGQLAEAGVERSADQQAAAATDELRRLLPWVRLDSLELATLRIDRAEGRDEKGRRPDTPVVRAHRRVVACWPTKLVLAPLAADRAAALAAAALPERRPARPPSTLPRPPVAEPIWDREDLRWSPTPRAAQENPCT